MAPLPKSKATRQRRNSVAGEQQLPMSGRKGRAPKWPLPEDPDVSILKRWRELWRLPQAIVWDDLQNYREVARYVLVEAAIDRQLLSGEDPSGALTGELRQAGDRLGMTPRALRSLGWDVSDDYGSTTSSVTELDKYKHLTG